MKMKKHLLVGAALFGAMSFSAANAIEINGSQIGAGPIADPTLPGYTPYTLASEVTNTSLPANNPDDGTITINFDPTTGTYPSGNVLFDLTITNSTFDGTIDGTDFDFSSCGGVPAPNANVSSGGGGGQSQVTFVVSNLNSCAPGDAPSLTIPVDVGASGAVTVQIGVRTEGGAPVDGGPVQYTAINRASAYAVNIVAGAVATADVDAVGVAYTDFDPTGAKDLGTFEIAIGSAFIDLDGTAASIADVQEVSIDVVGSFAGLDPVQYGTASGNLDGDDFVVVGTTASSVLSAALDISDLEAGPVPFQVVPDGDPISSSNYNATVQLDLVTGLNDPAAATGLVGRIERNGSSETLPWTASATQAAGTGSTTFVRVSNPTDEPFGAISARVLSSTNGATVGAEGQLAATLAAGGEALFTSQDLENILGNFGRGDIEIVVEGEGAYITRLLQRPDGTLEIQNRP